MAETPNPIPEIKTLAKKPPKLPRPRRDVLPAGYKAALDQAAEEYQEQFPRTGPAGSKAFTQRAAEIKKSKDLKGHQVYLMRLRDDGRMTVIPWPRQKLDRTKTEQLNAIRETANSSWKMISTMGFDKSIAHTLKERNQGSFATFLTIGPLKNKMGERDSYSNIISYEPNHSPERKALNLAHEIGHKYYALVSGDPKHPTLQNHIAAGLFHEAHSRVIELGGAYALHLRGDSRFWDKVVVTGLHLDYKAAFLDIAKNYPDLKERLQKDGKFPDAFMASLFKAFLKDPETVALDYYAGDGLSKKLPAAGLVNPETLAETVYFADAQQKQEIADILKKAAWVESTKRLKPGQDLSDLLQEEESIPQIAALKHEVDAWLKKPASERLNGSYDLIMKMGNNAHTSNGKINRTFLKIFQMNEAQLKNFFTKHEKMALQDGANQLAKTDLSNLAQMPKKERMQLFGLAGNVEAWAKMQGKEQHKAYMETRYRPLRLWYMRDILSENFSAENNQIWAKKLAEGLIAAKKDFTFFQEPGENKTSDQIANGLGFKKAMEKAPPIKHPVSGKPMSQKELYKTLGIEDSAPTKINSITAPRQSL